eukprot:gene1578-12703_t
MSDNLFRFGNHKIFETLKNNEVLKKEKRSKFGRAGSVVLIFSSVFYFFKSFDLEEFKFYVHSKLNEFEDEQWKKREIKYMKEYKRIPPYHSKDFKEEIVFNSFFQNLKNKMSTFGIKFEEAMYYYFPPSKDLPKNQRDFIQKRAKERKEFLKRKMNENK